MHTALRFAAALAVASLLAGCSTMTEGDFNSMHTALEGSPALKREAIRDCIARERSTSQADKNTYAAIMNVSPARYETAFCGRLMNALANGRITYGDYVKLSSPGADSSKLIKVMQGR